MPSSQGVSLPKLFVSVLAATSGNHAAVQPIRTEPTPHMSTDVARLTQMLESGARLNADPSIQQLLHGHSFHAHTAPVTQDAEKRNAILPATLAVLSRRGLTEKNDAYNRGGGRAGRGGRRRLADWSNDDRTEISGGRGSSSTDAGRGTGSTTGGRGTESPGTGRGFGPPDTGRGFGAPSGRRHLKETWTDDRGRTDVSGGRGSGSPDAGRGTGSTTGGRGTESPGTGRGFGSPDTGRGYGPPSGRRRLASHLPTAGRA